MKNKFTNMILEGPNCCGGAGNFYAPESENTNIEDFINKEACDASTNYQECPPFEIPDANFGNTILFVGSMLDVNLQKAAKLLGETCDFSFWDLTQSENVAVKNNVNNTEFQAANIKGGGAKKPQFTDNSFDSIISSSSLNFLVDKNILFAELHRFLKPNGCLYASEIVSFGDLPAEITKIANAYVGTLFGITDRYEYLNFIKKIGFKNIDIKSETKIDIPNEWLKTKLTSDEILEFKNSDLGIYCISTNIYK